ncbi:MAG: NAD(P)/FAD-dependent oxidoreductase [Verrucomicrobiae bacterium]|nr:NAD(P)/FAD-dependent oxidoreductase [Verrucomicrobiae bacterium]
MFPENPQVLVLGAGFGGLNFCKRFSYPRAQVTLVDHWNHHLFQPLLYQVATAGLSAPDIAQPIRSILRDQKNLTIYMDQVVDIRLSEKRVVLAQRALTYDYLVLALGGVTSYFGHPEWEAYAPGLKSLEDALTIRRNLLLAFERAEGNPTSENVKELLTLVVVGGGPTGVELAGAMAELARHVLKRDFRYIDPTKARIVLIEGGARLLPQFPEDLANNAKTTLEKMGVEVRLNSHVKNIREHEVHLENEVIRTANILWAAGVGASPLTKKLGVELDRAGRVIVKSDLSLPGYPEVFAIGDLAAVPWEQGGLVPGVAPAAIQMAHHVANVIQEEIHTEIFNRPARPEFHYWDKGSMATIGRSHGIAMAGKLKFTGFPAWFAWLVIHLLFLVGLRNKISVVIQWIYSYFTYKRGARIVFESSNSKALSSLER